MATSTRRNSTRRSRTAVRKTSNKNPSRNASRSLRKTAGRSSSRTSSSGSTSKRAARTGTSGTRTPGTGSQGTRSQGTGSRGTRSRGRTRSAGAGDAILHLDRWIRENRKHLKPPVSNRQLFTESDDAIVFVSGGPNTRNDYHVNPTEELFYQLKGDIAVRIRPLDGSPPRDVVIREGELYLLPRWVPHRPQRPAGTIGLIIEFPRPKGEKDGLRWYCPECDELVHEARWRLKKIDEDLKVIMERFWGGPAKRRTCKSCGHMIERAGEFRLDSPRGGAKSAGGRASSRTSARSAKAPRRSASVTSRSKASKRSGVRRTTTR